MKKWGQIVLLILMGGAVYYNSLFNGFVSDDHIVIEKNLFYKSWNNLPRLFDNSYLAHQNDYFIKEPPYDSSGAVSYRPMISLFYFLDYHFWQENPFGWHLDSVVLHLINTLLLYYLVLLMLKNETTAFLTAVFFCVHPVQSEAVNVISYRHAMLDTFFVLLGLIFYVKASAAAQKRNMGCYVLSLLCYFFAVFSRESAVVFPFIVFLYDFFVLQQKEAINPRQFIRRYTLFYVVTLFFLYIYFFVFPNTALPENHLLGGALGVHALSIVMNFFRYLFWLLFPMFVNVVAPMYAPVVNQETLGQVIVNCLAFLTFIMLSIKCVRGEKKALFFSLWFVVFFLPISNVIPLANPVAQRFMYLPSIGICALAAIFSQQLLSEFKRLGTGLISFLILLLCGMTISLNMLWANDLRLFLTLTRLYPENLRSQEFLGMVYFNMGLDKEAEEHLQKALELGSQDPRMETIFKIMKERKGL